MHFPDTPNGTGESPLASAKQNGDTSSIIYSPRQACGGRKLTTISCPALQRCGRRSAAGHNDHPDGLALHLFFSSSLGNPDACNPARKTNIFMNPLLLRRKETRWRRLDPSSPASVAILRAASTPGPLPAGLLRLGKQATHANETRTGAFIRRHRSKPIVIKLCWRPATRGSSITAGHGVLQCRAKGNLALIG